MSKLTHTATSTLSRWAQREAAGRQACMRPGPQKLEPLDLQMLDTGIAELRFKQRRVYGTTELYKACSASLSRRDLQERVQDERDERNRQHRASQRRNSWVTPGLVWAMDDSEVCGANMHTIMDLASTWRFEPVISDHLLTGQEVAENLVGLFDQYGAPLFLKRDNGKNLNARAVREVLEHYYVLPLNSPCYYPQYNGGVERGQGVLKACLRKKVGKASVDDQCLQALATGTASECNVARRRMLGGRTPTELYGHRRVAMQPFTKTKRKEVYDWIMDRSLDMMSRDMSRDPQMTMETAYRISAERWLIDNGHLVQNKGKSVNLFSRARRS